MGGQFSRGVLVLGQPVHRSTDPSGQRGYIVGVMLVPPHDAVVRWEDDGTSFERLDDLVDAVPERIDQSRAEGFVQSPTA